MLAFLGGAALVFDAPNRHALTFQLVGRDELPNAVALNSSLFNAGRVVGPAVGGILIAAVGAGWCFAVNAGYVPRRAGRAAADAALGALPGRARVDRREDRRRDPRGARLRVAPVACRLVLLVTIVISMTGFNFRVLLPVLAS